METTSAKQSYPAGYSALIKRYGLRVPGLAHSYAIGERHSIQHLPDCTLLSPRHAPTDDIPGQLTFALKYESVQLHILRPLFVQLDATKITDWVRSQPTSTYARRIWFLYEWLMDAKLPLQACQRGNLSSA